MKTRAYKYKMKPTFKQQECLNKAFGCCRFIYNWGLDKKIQSYKQEKKTIGYVELAHELTKLKNDGAGTAQTSDITKNKARIERFFGLCFLFLREIYCSAN